MFAKNDENVNKNSSMHLFAYNPEENVRGSPKVSLPPITYAEISFPSAFENREIS